MPGNSFGSLFRLTSFGESHGIGLGGIIDGCPAGIAFSEQDMQRALDLRKPGTCFASTTRKESDRVEILSGLFEGKTTGTPLAFIVRNENQRSKDYDALRSVFRPGHADWGFFAKYGIRDHRGGGRSSGRETIARVAAGALADAVLAQTGILVLAGTVEIAGKSATKIDIEGAGARPYFSVDEESIPLWDEEIRKAKADGDSVGGIVRLEARSVPAGLGEPVFDKLDAMIAHALMSVGAVKGVEIGDGFAAARLRGSQNNDAFLPGPRFASNHAGGILGGISSGQDIVATVAVKPIPSIGKEQETITIQGESTRLSISGRHDVSAIPRCVPVLRAMLSLVLVDALLLQRI